MVKVDDRIFTGMETLFRSQDRFTDEVMKGRWPLPFQKPEVIRDALENHRKELNEGFERSVNEKAMELTDYSFHSVEDIKSSERFFEVKENPPGEIDVLSFLPEDKKVVVWEAKDIGMRFGARELANKIDHFEGEDGFIQKLEGKKEYIEQNLEEFLESLELEEGDWSVESLFVFSEDTLLKEVVNEKKRAIAFGRIEGYLE